MLTLNVKERTGQTFTDGWHELTIAKAVDGNFNGTRYVDLFFEDHPESLKCRVWSAVNGTTGEEFGVGKLFYHANAGITTSDDGKVTIDDNAVLLRGKKVHVMFYHNESGYTDCVGRIVPIVQETTHLTVNDDEVAILKLATERWHNNKPNTATNGVTNCSTNGTEEAVPF